jgi:hypothetical protein
MKALIWLTVGFLLPAFCVAGLLWVDFISNRWSGNSPLNNLLWIPVGYLTSILLSSIIMVYRQRRFGSWKYLLMAGVVGGLPLLLTAHQTASMISGGEVPILVALYGCMLGLIWQSGKGGASEL